MGKCAYCSGYLGVAKGLESYNESLSNRCRREMDFLTSFTVVLPQGCQNKQHTLCGFK